MVKQWSLHSAIDLYEKIYMRYYRKVLVVTSTESAKAEMKIAQSHILQTSFYLQCWIQHFSPQDTSVVPVEGGSTIELCILFALFGHWKQEISDFPRGIFFVHGNIFPWHAPWIQHCLHISLLDFNVCEHALYFYDVFPILRLLAIF